MIKSDGLGAASARDGISLGFRYDIRSVRDELTIDAKNGLERALDLRLRIVLRLQSAHRHFDQFTQDGNVFGNSEPEMNVGLRHCSKGGGTGVDFIAE